VCGITHKIHGLEHLPEGKCVIASKHQSAWDTMIFFALMKHPVFVMKKELLKVPLFGSFMARMGMIPVDRKGGASALKFMLSEVKKRLANGMSLVLFPEGTRTEVGQLGTYHPGIASVYQEQDLDVLFVPVALDSGKLWNKNTMLKYPGVITIRFQKPIAQGMPRKEFMKKLQEEIESGCREIANQ
jgi:1-acyl-sn-glycerol-3-phosphate acyltransferase